MVPVPSPARGPTGTKGGPLGGEGKNVEVDETYIGAKAKLVTDESGVYPHAGKEFAAHGTVTHTVGEYVKADGTHTNTVESSFALLKRGVYGTFHSIARPVCIAT